MASRSTPVRLSPRSARRRAPRPQPATTDRPGGGDAEAAVLRYAETRPQLGQASVAALLRADGIDVSPSGVRYLWRKHGLETTFKRLQALERAEGDARALSGEELAILRRGHAQRRLAGEARGTTGLPPARRELLLAAAAQVFVERGYAGTSMREIARRAGLLAGSVYHYYRAKEDLFLAVQKEGFRQIEARVRQRIGASTRAWERLELACAEHVESVVAGDPISRVTAIGLFAIHDPAVNRRLKRERDRYENVYREIIMALDLPRDTDRSLFRLALFGALNWTLVWYAPGALSPREIAARIVAMLHPR